MPQASTARNRRDNNSNWWRKRSRLELCLILCCGVALITSIVLVVHLAMITARKCSTTDQIEVTGALCLTPECIQTASSVLSKMNPKVNPCDDFYQFACGSYIENESIPEDKVGVDTFKTIEDELEKQLKIIITKERSTEQPRHFHLPNALYKACMNKTLIENLGASPITNISETLGGWPLIKGDQWDLDGKWNWQDTIKMFRRLGLGYDYILSFGVNKDFKNNTKRIIMVDQASLGLNREYLVKGFNETFVNAYYEFMVDIAVLFGAEMIQAQKELKESLQFEMDLANISLPKEDKRNLNEAYHLHTLKEIQQYYPHINWLEYINSLLPMGPIVGENEVINLIEPSFFRKLNLLLSRTPKRVIANYLMWRIHQFSLQYISETFASRQFKFHVVIHGLQAPKPRWQECLSVVNDELSVLVSSLYVQKYFNKDSETIVLEMVQLIRAAFDEILDEVAWMDSETKMAAKKKLHAMRSNIGYPNEWLDHDILKKYYHNVDIDPDKYFESIRKLKVHFEDYEFSKLRLPVNKTDWENHVKAADVNAYYSVIMNQIEICLAIQQGHIFNALRPKYMNFGAIGSIIGHEFTHGFDDEGRQSDLDGNLVDWWRPDTAKVYLEKAKCIIEQYGNYTDILTGLHLNGIDTQGENIADNVGIKEAYIAYKKWTAENGSEPKLPGLDLTAEQMFWISFAQVWCSASRKEWMKMYIITDGHSTGEFRVLGTTRNNENFAKDFNCAKSSPMNPLHKCEVW